ncbi:MAG: peptide chain release factor N(5)-glutamine methyltransferase [Candidatus Babeliales bacterium]
MHKIDILKLIHNMASQLESCCKDKINAEQEAWWLVEKLTNKSKTWLLSNPNRSFSASEQEQLTQWIIDRVQHNKPLAYILGSVPFCDLEILVKPPILIPRPETEEWVSWLIEQLKQANFTKFIALDLCCGSGCIGLAIAKAFPKSKIIGIDINPEAIKLSIENKNHNKIENIDFIQSDLFQNLPSNFSCNLIVSNPPYLAKQELANLDPDVKDWEDHMALVAQDEGMYFYHKIFTESPKFLLPIESSIPQIVVEIGPAQRTIENILPTYKFKNFILYKDMQHQGRWVGCWI